MQWQRIPDGHLHARQPVRRKGKHVENTGAKLRRRSNAAEMYELSETSWQIRRNTRNAVWVNQFDNTANRQAHFESTGPEIWQQTNGDIDAFTCAVGTGGTLAGVSRFLKEKNKDIKIVLADPFGSALYNYVTTGEASMTPGPSITEGIGNSRVTDNLAGTQIDDAVQIADQNG